MSPIPGAAALWWCYFDRAEGMGRRASQHAADAGAVAPLGSASLALMVLGLIGIAVGAEVGIAHPGADPEASFQVLTVGGPVLFLLAQVIFMVRIGEPPPRSRVLGILALAVLGVATAASTHLVGAAAATLVLLAVAAGDTVADTRAPAT